MISHWNRVSYKSKFFTCVLSMIFLFSLPSCSTSKKLYDEANDLESIKTVLKEQEKAWSDGNIDAFMEGYWKSEDLSFIGSKGVTKGWNATLANYKKGYPDKAAMGILQFEIIELTSLGPEAAYMIGKYTLIRAEDKPSGYFNLLWRKINGQWVICSDHTSS